jgi:serine/threonine-protein kinase
VIGTTIGNYVVRKKIGQGGMGAVYLAEHPRIGRQVAIKVLLPEVSKKAEVVQRFFTEARSSSEIHNEHIIDVLDYGELADGTSYLIMEWLEGKSLRDALRGGKMPVERALHIARGIARALAAAHARGIVHRDLKPDNIFLIPRGDDPDFVKVLDFGIAKLMQPDNDMQVKTQTGALIGTPSFMSPEQCRGQPIDQRTDLYALGVIMYQMLTGRLPFIAEGLGELLLAHMTQPPRPPRELSPEIPPTVEQTVLRCLEKDQAKRFQTAEEILAAIGGELSGPVYTGNKRPSDAPTLARGPNSDTIGGAVGEALPTTMGQKRRSWVIAAGSLAVVAAGGAAFFFLRPGPPAQPVIVVSSPPAAQPPAQPPVQPPTVATAQVRIKTVPADAVVLLDEAKVSNPFDGKFARGDVKHRIVVKAPGYRTEAEWITFEADRDLEIKLEKGGGTHERGTKPVAATPETGKPIYKGTKGKLITDFPD